MNLDVNGLLERWSFNWGVMEVFVAGKSAVDLTELQIRDWQDATHFLKYYGYDPDHPRDARRIHAVIVESLSFIERFLMPAEWQAGCRPPDDLLYAHDARHILLCAADTRDENSQRQAWACAMLRVMHTIAHIEGVYRLTDIDEAREQIMSRFRGFLFRDDDGHLRFGTRAASIELTRVEWKNNKSRESIILKLLHKKANVAETIYDLLGVRIVTRHLGDVMLALKFLQEHHMVSYPNCNPGRSRNTLIDLDQFHYNVDVWTKLLKSGRMDVEEFNRRLEDISEQLVAPAPRDPANPHTGRNYRSVQLTCRQLIRSRHPQVKWRDRLKHFMEFPGADPKAKAILQDILLLSSCWGEQESYEDTSGYFPYEVHILDEESYEHNLRGDASHDRYKRSQIKATRKRVLSRVLALEV